MYYFGSFLRKTSNFASERANRKIVDEFFFLISAINYLEYVQLCLQVGKRKNTSKVLK